MKLDMIKLQWDGSEGKLKLTDNWKAADWVVQADMLVDCIHDLRELYVSMLAKPEVKDE
jgi:hypothetical protein